MRRVGCGDTEFQNRLDRLKREGSALLVVGDVPDECYAPVSRQMLGDAEHGSRSRALVLGGRERPLVTDRFTRSSPGRDRLRLVTHGTTARSAVESAQGLPSNTPTTHVDAADVEGLGHAVLDAVEALEGPGFEPAELRVGVDTVQTLFDVADEFTVFALVDLLSHRVRSADGMIHFRLPRPRDAYHVRLLESIVDAVVELRLNGDDVEQRWEVIDGDVTSPWTGVE